MYNSLGCLLLTIAPETKTHPPAVALRREIFGERANSKIYYAGRAGRRHQKRGDEEGECSDDERGDCF